MGWDGMEGDGSLQPWASIDILWFQIRSTIEVAHFCEAFFLNDGTP